MYICIECRQYTGVFLYKGSSYCGGCLTKVKPSKSNKSTKDKTHGKTKKA